MRFFTREVCFSDVIKKKIKQRGFLDCIFFFNFASFLSFLFSFFTSEPSEVDRKVDPDGDLAVLAKHLARSRGVAAHFFSRGGGGQSVPSK